MEAYLVMDRSDLDEMERLKGEVKRVLRDRFGVEYTTLEVEIDACGEHEQFVIPK